MDAKARTVSEILHEAAQYQVPLFQRSYSWHKNHWQRLNDDVMALVDDPTRQVHFLGPLVCTMGKSVPGTLPVYQLIDGQQRLTTLTVALAALRDVARDRGLTDLAEEITEDYLIHKRKQDLERFKVLPRTGDREALKAIVEADDLAPFAQLRLVHAWRFFRRQIQHRARKNPGAELQNLFDTLIRRLSLVVVSIDGENPYEIFESLNATGLPLAESDLIRNHVFMQIPIAEQDAFERTHWQPLERHFVSWGESRPAVMTGFYRDYLMRDGQYSREKSTFVGFKDQQKARGLDAKAQAEELQHYAPLAVHIRKPQACPSPLISRRLYEVVLTDIGTANAFVLHLLDLHSRGQLSEMDLSTCLSDLVSFVLRRTVCGESTRAYNRWFVEAIGAAGGKPVENLRRYWLERGWPDDTALTRALSEFQIYKREPRKARMVLEALELSVRHKEQVDFANLTVEHVMPQSITDDAAGQAWKTALGENWNELHERYLHVLGNLTLTGYNPELGKMAFSNKQTVYKDSHVDLNRHFCDLVAWDSKAIEKRTTALAAQLCQVWSRPKSDQPYTSGEDDLSDDKKASPAKKRNLGYWSAFLKLWPERLGPPPAPSDGVEQIIPLDEERGVSIHLWQFRRERKAVAYVRFEGKPGRRLYVRLHEIAKEIDDQIAGDLVWDWPVRNGFAVVDEGVDFRDRHDWEIQHAWFIEELLDIMEALTPELAQPYEEDEESGPDATVERHRLRYQFWTELLELAATKTELHANRKPGKFNWIGGGIGRAGFSLNYAVREHEAQVELYIDLGKGCESENETAFATLKKEAESIEAVFDGPLDWQDLPGIRACRICKVIDGGWKSEPESWSETHAAMVDAMIQLDRAVRPHVQGLRL